MTDHLAMWNRLELSDKAFLKRFDNGSFKGVSIDTTYNLKRITAELGPVGFAWGWEIRDQHAETYGEGKDAQTVHIALVRAWFRQEDGSTRHVEQIGTTKLAYWTKSGRFLVDEEAPKKSVTDALSKIMLALGAGADIRLGRFDGDKYQAPQVETTATENHDPETGEVRDTTPTYPLGDRWLTAEAWLLAAGDDARNRNGDLATWWDGLKGVRSNMYRARPDLKPQMKALGEEITARIAAAS